MYPRNVVTAARVKTQNAVVEVLAVVMEVPAVEVLVVCIMEAENPVCRDVVNVSHISCLYGIFLVVCFLLADSVVVCMV